MVRGLRIARSLTPSQGAVRLLHYPRMEPQRAFQPARLFTKQDQEFSWGKWCSGQDLHPQPRWFEARHATLLHLRSKNGASPTNRTWIPTFAKSCDIYFTNEA